MRPSNYQFRLRVNHRGYCALSALILVTLAALQALGQANETIGLYQAMREGKVATNFTATGASSGDAIDLTISKTPAAGQGTLTVTIPPGLRLHNTNASWQSMVVSGVRGRLLGGNSYMPQPVITLSDAAPVATYLLSAYCAEFHKDNPSPSSQFIVEFPDSTTACVLSNASARGLSVAATQAAEWINTDRVTFNDLQAKFPVSFPDWNAATQVASQCQQTQVQFQPLQIQPVTPAPQYNPPTVNGALINIPASNQQSDAKIGPIWVLEPTWRSLTAWSGALYFEGSRIRLDEGKHSFEHPLSDIADISFSVGPKPWPLNGSQGYINVAFRKPSSKKLEQHQFISNFKDDYLGMKECERLVTVVKQAIGSPNP